MLTAILAFICIFAGAISFIVGAFGGWMLVLHEGKPRLRYYVLAFGLMLTGIILVGLGQGLRLLLVINADA